MNSLTTYTQIAIIAASSPSETIGEVFPIMQTIVKKDVSLSVPKFEVPIERPKQKQPTFWQKLKLIIKNLFK